MNAAPALTGQVALVTGGASGIGAAIASELAGRGASVAVTDIDDTKLDTARAKGQIALRVDNRSAPEIGHAVTALIASERQLLRSADFKDAS